MAGVVPFLTGGSSSKQQSSSQASQFGVQSSTPADYQWSTGLRDPFAQVLAQVLGGGAAGFNPYSGGPAPTAQMGAAEAAALQQVGQTAGNTLRQDEINRTLSGGYLPGQAGGNPFLQAAIEAAQRPTAMALENAIQRRLPGQFAAAGHQLTAGGSSPYARELNQAAYTGGRALGDIATQMSSAAYEAERGRQQSAVQLDQSQIDAAIKNFQAQALPRLIEQQGIEAGAATGQAQVNQFLQFLQTMGGVTSPALANSSFGLQQGQSTSQSTGSSNLSKGLFDPLRFAPLFG